MKRQSSRSGPYAGRRTTASSTPMASARQRYRRTQSRRSSVPLAPRVAPAGGNLRARPAARHAPLPQPWPPIEDEVEGVEEQPTLVPLPPLPALAALPSLASSDSAPNPSPPPIREPADAVPTRRLDPDRIKRVLLMAHAARSPAVATSVAVAPATDPAADLQDPPATPLVPLDVPALGAGSSAAGALRAAISRATASLAGRYAQLKLALRSQAVGKFASAALKLLLGVVGVLLALATAALFARAGIERAISDQMVTVGFDAERGRMIAAFALVLLAAGSAGFVVLRRGAAWLGGFLAFVQTYLWPFYQQAQHPLAGPDGQTVTIDAATLDHIVLALAALAVIFAAAGAVLGEALGRLVLPPLVALGRQLWMTLRTRQPGRPKSYLPAARQLATGSLVVLALAVGLPQLGELLTFGASTQLYQPAEALAADQRGIVEQGTYVSPALGGAVRHFSIYLPPSYVSADPSVMGAAMQRFPVVYLLHGAPGGPTDWFSAGHAAAIADALSARQVVDQVIIVCPDGNGSIYRVSAWVNSFDDKQRMEDAIATDLVAYIDSHYRTLADPTNRVIGGLSEGGFGAINIALHHPEVFGKAMSLDGFFQTDTGNPAFGRGKRAQGYQHYNSPFTYLQSPEGQKAARQLQFVIGVGTKDSFYKSGLAFVQELTTLGMNVELIQTDGGHSWVQWGQQLGAALPVLVPTPRRQLPRQHLIR